MSLLIAKQFFNALMFNALTAIETYVLAYGLPSGQGLDSWINKALAGIRYGPSVRQGCYHNQSGCQGLDCPAVH